MFVPGEGPVPCDVMFVGEAPGRDEDLAGRPFIGRSGQELERYLNWVGLSRRDFYITNLVKIRPPENEDPTAELIAEHERYLIEELRLVRPKLVVTIGRIAAHWFLGSTYNDDGWGHIDMQMRHSIPHPVENALLREWKDDDDMEGLAVLPVYHPAYGLRQPESQRAIEYGFEVLAGMLRGELPWHPPTDRYRGKERYVLLTDTPGGQPDPQLEEFIPETAGVIALDTEGTIARPWCLSGSCVPGEAFVVKPASPATLKALDRRIKLQDLYTVMHYAIHDLPVLRALGITLPVEPRAEPLGEFATRMHDTMVMAYNTAAGCNDMMPQGLKPLSYRLHGMEMEHFEDLTREPAAEKARIYVERVMFNGRCKACRGTGKIPKLGKKGQRLKSLTSCPGCGGDGARYPQPEPLVMWEGGSRKLYRAQGIGRRLRRALSDWDAGKPVDLRDRWYSIDVEIRKAVEEELGVMPAATLDDVDSDRAIRYAARDADATLRDYLTMQAMIDDAEIRTVQSIDEAILPMVARMESVGIKIDANYFWKLTRKFESEMHTIRQRIKKLVGYPVNPSSSKQVANLLFEKLKLPVIKLTKSREGESTDDKVLEQLKIMTSHPVIDLLTEFRELHKLKGTYTEPAPTRMDRHGRLHPDIKTTRTRSGRLSMADPNLQNIPARSERGKLIRYGFIAKPGHLLGSWDLSQIEMRVLAHESRDPSLMRMFIEGATCPIAAANKGKCRCHDMHIYGAMKCWGILMDAVTDDQRTSAKCFHPDTEVLTHSGWKRIVDLSPGEHLVQATPGRHYTVDLEWVVPLEVFTMKHPSGRLVHLKNQGMDLRVTPDHRMLGWTDHGYPTITTPERLNCGVRGWANAGVLEGTRVVDEHLLRIAVATQADGSITPSGRIRFGFTRLRKIERMRTLLTGRPYSTAIHRNGKNPLVTAFALSKGDSAAVAALLDGKQFPWWWLHLTAALRAVVLEEAELWDAHSVERRYLYASTNKQSADVLQAIAATTGRKTRMHTSAPRRAGHAQLYNLTVRNAGRTRSGNLAAAEIPYDGEVACLTVPSSFVLVRDGVCKTPVITGQSVGFGVVYGITAEGLMAQLRLRGINASLEEAQALIDAYLNDAFPGVRDFMADAAAEARRTGQVVDLCGRPRVMTAVRSAARWVASEAVRQAGNHKIQAGAQEVEKRLMLHVDVLLRKLRREGWDIECLLQIHDELIFEGEEGVEAGIDAAMPGLIAQVGIEMGITVPLTGSGKWAKTWGELK